MYSKLTVASNVASSGRERVESRDLPVERGVGNNAACVQLGGAVSSGWRGIESNTSLTSHSATLAGASTSALYIH